MNLLDTIKDFINKNRRLDADLIDGGEMLCNNIDSDLLPFFQSVNYENSFYNGWNPVIVLNFEDLESKLAFKIRFASANYLNCIIYNLCNSGEKKMLAEQTFFSEKSKHRYFLLNVFLKWHLG